MQIQIQNYKGIQSANFELPKGGLVTIAGKTGYGKTSICEAIRCACIADWKLFPKMTKEQAKMVVNRLALRDEMEGKGKAVSECTIVDPDFDVTASWSEQKVGGVGISHSGSLAYIVGHKNICTVDSEVSSEVLTEVLALKPQKQDLVTALPSIPEPKVQTIWTDIEKTNWDTAMESQSAVGRSKKGEWEKIVGSKYGGRKGENYIPEGWSPELKNASEAKLREELVEAERRFEACVKAQGISEDHFDALTEKSESLDELEEEFRILGDERTAQAKITEDLRNERDKLPAPQNTEPVECPHCKKELLVTSGKVAPFKKPTKKQLESREALSTKLKQEVDKGSNMDKRMSKLLKEIEGARKAKEELANAHVEDKTSNENLEKARVEVEKAKLRITAFEKKTKADELHKEISEIVVIVKQLKADGVRKTILGKRLVKFNELLAVISEEIAVSVDENLNFFIKGIPYFLASGGQKQYLQGIIQIALAHVSKTPLTVIDVDKMDNDYYGHLKAIGERAKFAVLIAGFGIPNPTHKIENDSTGMIGKLKEVKDAEN